MLVVGGTAAANDNVLSPTELNTLYQRGHITVRAVASAAAPTVPTVSASFKSGSQLLADGVWVRTQDQGVAENIGPGMGDEIYSGPVPAGSLSLVFSAACYWTATLS